MRACVEKVDILGWNKYCCDVIEIYQPRPQPLFIEEGGVGYIIAISGILVIVMVGGKGGFGAPFIYNYCLSVSNYNK